MNRSAIEVLEPRWAPARLLTGLLPAQFGVDLTAGVASAVDSPSEISAEWESSNPSAALNWMANLPAEQDRGSLPAFHDGRLDRAYLDEPLSAFDYLGRIHASAVGDHPMGTVFHVVFDDSGHASLVPAS